MRVLTPNQFFNLNWYVSKVEITSMTPAKEGEPGLAIGYVMFHVKDEVNGAEPDEDMMCVVFPWYSEIQITNGRKYIPVDTEQDDCWLSAHQFMFERGAVPSHREFSKYFSSITWRTDVQLKLLYC